MNKTNSTSRLSARQPTGGTMKLTSLTLAAALIGSAAFAAEVGPKDIKFNDDGAVDVKDINPFVTLLAGP